MNYQTLPSRDLLVAREKIVLDHFHDEVLQQWNHVLATFPHPHYEIIATMTVHDGDKEVRDYYQETRVAFPDQNHEMISLRHSHDAVITEFWLIGTHLGPLGSIPATGSQFRVRITAFFIFDEREQLIIERIYFDTPDNAQAAAGWDRDEESEKLAIGAESYPRLTQAIQQA